MNRLACAPAFFLPIAFALVLAAPSCSPGGDGGADKPGFKSWAYIMSGTIDPEKDSGYLSAAAARYDALCITGYYINSRGDLITSEPVSALARKLRSARTLYPLVAFSSIPEGTLFLKSPSAWENAAQRIASLLERTPFNGVHFDFEYLAPELAPRLAEFLALVKEAISASGRGTLGMAVFPRVDFPEKWSAFHNLALLGKHLDEIVLMCYDLNRADTAPGPVVSLKWAERNIARAARDFPAARTWLGVPAYGYVWPPKGKAAVIPARDAVLESARANGKRDPSGTVTYAFTNSTGTYTAYFADTETRRMMTELAVRTGLKGTALWRLGMED